MVNERGSRNDARRSESNSGNHMGQWEFLQTRAARWKWRQLGTTGLVVCESAEFAFLARCMEDAERNGFRLDEYVISCAPGAALWSEAPETPV